MINGRNEKSNKLKSMKGMAMKKGIFHSLYFSGRNTDAVRSDGCKSGGLKSQRR